jgi:hypothetical protein
MMVGSVADLVTQGGVKKCRLWEVGGALGGCGSCDLTTTFHLPTRPERDVTD